MSIEGQGHFLTLAQGYFCLKIKTCFSQKPPGHFNQILYVSLKVHGNENLLHDAGHMTKMAATPIYGRNPSKILFSGTSGQISTKLGI